MTAFKPAFTRRRAITILASATALAPGLAHAADVQRWRGRAMGADVSLDLHGATPEDLAASREVIAEVEARFSVYDPRSELSRLNDAGGGALSVEMAALLALCGEMHARTDGLFDPTIQPVFAALARREAPPWERVGWHRVRLSADRLALAPRQALTLNGIAQGHATDRVRALLAARGLRHALVSVGEHAAIGGPFRLGLEDPVHGALGVRTLTNGALATSSPGALVLGKHHHILHPTGGQPPWSTVSVEANSAALADALSTALCLAPLDKVDAIARAFAVRVTLVDRSGDVRRLG